MLKVRNREREGRQKKSSAPDGALSRLRITKRNSVGTQVDAEWAGMLAYAEAKAFVGQEKRTEEPTFACRDHAYGDRAAAGNDGASTQFLSRRMHAITHSLAHRAPPATRTRVRWQPYNSIPSSSSSSSSMCSRSPQSSYINTPSSSVTSSPPTAPTPTCELDRLRQPLPCNPLPTQISKEAQREVAKNKFALGLVDQAVKSLCEIWRPQDIPPVFFSAPKAATPVGVSVESTHLQKQLSQRLNNTRNAQLPSPVSPNTQPSPQTTTTSPPTAQVLLQHCENGTCDSRQTLVPIKGFVHEVLRRSRTSGCVLQTALCYLEAIRPKIPELIRQNREGQCTRSKPESDSRITLATPAELEREAELSRNEEQFTSNTPYSPDDSMDTIRIADDSVDCTSDVSRECLARPQQMPTDGSASLPQLPPLPSPLLCPRRAFLASLILASKFTQDKCYSNRAWAKLSGLPAREIGRCERALGEALEWRLWVGKAPVASSSAPVQRRAIVKCQSESSLFAASSSSGKTQFLGRGDAGLATKVQPPVASGSRDRPAFLVQRSLQRSATLPAEAFATPAALASSGWGTSAMQSQDVTMFTPKDGYPFQPQAATSFVENSRSPIPDTPGLSYSPTLTESSSGDRTVQMSTYLDDSAMPSFLSSQPSIDAVRWTDTTPTNLNLIFSVANNSASFGCNKAPTTNMYPQIDISLATPEATGPLEMLLSKPGPYGPDMQGSYPWGLDSGFLAPGIVQY
ncbi:hypothetical protein BDQ12DRAFT_717562 [Crucibulum laeve]|uniref:Cyclin N-terminal domain-containing protein n=1 Tax=Crucibulum laeve TaxID=68775 RepID=A0A5C3MJ50_9AGAR|nr:hypothetical protein BDQ12DRAFT_717562 [Crucibulum laeve]